MSPSEDSEILCDTKFESNLMNTVRSARNDFNESQVLLLDRKRPSADDNMDGCFADDQRAPLEPIQSLKMLAAVTSQAVEEEFNETKHV